MNKENKAQEVFLEKEEQSVDRALQVSGANRVVLVWMVLRENKGRREYLDTRDPLVWLVCLEKEVDQEWQDIKEEEETQDCRGPKEGLGNKANADYKG